MTGLNRLGQLLGVSAALVCVVACGSSSAPTAPTSPSPVNPLLQGNAWTIYFILETCTSTRERDTCPAWSGASFMEMSMRTATVGQTPTAILTPGVSWITNMPVVLDGQVLPDGSVRFSGIYTSEQATTVFRSLEIQELILRADANSGLTGTLALIETSSARVLTVRARVQSASHQSFPDTPRTFQGRFDGFGTLRACDGTCPNRANGERFPVSLRLSQAGASVTGEFGTMPVNGSVTGNSVSLTGEWRGDLSFGLGTTLSRIESFTASIDALGRLTGSIRLYNEGVYDSRPGAITEFTPFTEQLTIDLTTVVRQ